MRHGLGAVHGQAVGRLLGGAQQIDIAARVFRQRLVQRHRAGQHFVQAAADAGLHGARRHVSGRAIHHDGFLAHLGRGAHQRHSDGAAAFAIVGRGQRDDGAAAAMRLQLADQGGHGMGIFAGRIIQHEIGGTQLRRVIDLRQDRRAVPYGHRLRHLRGSPRHGARTGGGTRAHYRRGRDRHGGRHQRGIAHAIDAHRHQRSQLFGDQRRQQAQDQAQRDRGAHDQGPFGAAGIGGHRRRADDAAIGRLHIVQVLAGAQALHERLILRAGGGGIGFQRLQLDACHVLDPRSAFGAAQAALQRIQMRAAHHHVVGGRSRQPVHFLGDLHVQVALLLLHGLELGMQRAVLAVHVGFLAQKLRLLRAQLNNERRRHDGADIGGIARCHQLVDAVLHRLLFGQVRALLHDLRIDGGHLLVHERVARRGIIQIVLRLVALDGFFLHLKLLRQIRQTRVQPAGGGGGGVDLGGDLGAHIGIRQRIGDQRRLVRIVRGGGDGDGGGKPLGIGADMLEEGVDDAVAADKAGDRRVVLEPVLGIDQRHHHPHQLHQAGLGEGGIEFRIIVQLQPGDDFGRQFARLQNLKLVLHRGRVGRQLRQHRRQIGDIVLARFQHHHRRARPGRGQHDGRGQAAQDDAQRHAGDQPAARIDHAHQVGKLEGGRRGRRHVSGRRKTLRRRHIVRRHI